MSDNSKSVKGLKPLVCIFASGLLLSAVQAQSVQGKQTAAMTAAPAPTTASLSPKRSSPYRRIGSSGNAREFYALHWGVDSFSAKLVESGQMVRFSYRVIDPVKAKPLSDKKSAPFLLDESAHVKLVVPTMEKVGELRQSATPEAGKQYWMVFSNKGRFVKSGDRVSVVIGGFHADQVVVQ
jgi:hypothetical protein